MPPHGWQKREEAATSSAGSKGCPQVDSLLVCTFLPCFFFFGGAPGAGRGKTQWSKFVKMQNELPLRIVSSTLGIGDCGIQFPTFFDFYCGVAQ